MARVQRLPRRAFLRGIGGAAVALPALEIMSDARAGGDENIPRFLTSYVGVSTGRTHYIDDICCEQGPPSDRLTPDIAGPNYDIKQALQAIGNAPWQYQTGWGGDQPFYDIQSELSIVSGLVVPWEENGVIPPGGRCLGFHYGSTMPQYTGARSYQQNVGPDVLTVDRLVAEAVGPGSGFDALAYRVEVMDYYYGGQGGDFSAMSWKRGVDGSAMRVDPISNPGFAWETLFEGFESPDPAQAAQKAFELQQRRTVLDLVGSSAQRLVQRLGREDRLRMEQHFEEIRSLERRLEDLHPPSIPLCEMTPNPGQDWAPGVPGEDVETETNKWSNEELRAEIFVDLIHMAFVCDLTRVASLMFEHWKSYLNMYPATGHLADLHDTTHFGGYGTGIGPQSDALAWHIKHFARLVRKLADTPDPDGVPVLDRCVLTLGFEGGWGWDPESGDNGPHSTENMSVLVAGGRALGLTPGRHLRGNGAHPASVLLAGARACGMKGPLNDIADPFVGL